MCAILMVFILNIKSDFILVWFNLLCLFVISKTMLLKRFFFIKEAKLLVCGCLGKHNPVSDFKRIK